MAAVVSITPFLHRPLTTGALLGERGTPAQKGNRKRAGAEILAASKQVSHVRRFTLVVLRSWDAPQRYDRCRDLDWEGSPGTRLRVIVLPRRGAPIVHDGVKHIRRPGYEVGRPQLALMGTHGRRLACYPVPTIAQVIIEETKQPGHL